MAVVPVVPQVDAAPAGPVLVSVPSGVEIVTRHVPEVVDSCTVMMAVPSAWPESRNTGLATTVRRAL